MASEYILEIKNCRKEFPGVVALDNVSLFLRRGEVHALMGENGAGKSTIMKILAGIYQPDGGEILLDGQPYHAKAPIDALTKGISIYKVLENYPDINVLYTQTGNWNREEGMSLMENWLQTGAQIDAVVAHNDDMALGAYDALVDAGLDGEILCIGIDAIAAAMQSVAAGELDATVLQDSYGIGAKGIEVALKAVAGETLESTYYIDPVLLTIDNIGDYYTG